MHSQAIICHAITKPQLLLLAARVTSFHLLYPWLACPAPAMSQNLVRPDSPPPHFPNEILLQIISILQSNRDDISHGTLYSFLRVSRNCYSLTFQALYQCPYVTAANYNQFNQSLVKSGYGSMVKRLYLPCLPELYSQSQPSDEDSIIQECKDGLEEFIALEDSLQE